MIKQMYLIPEQAVAEDLQLVAALPSCVRDSYDMYAVMSASKFALMYTRFPELPQIDVYHVYRLDVRYRLHVERSALLVSERLLGPQQEQGRFLSLHINRKTLMRRDQHSMESIPVPDTQTRSRS